LVHALGETRGWKVRPGSAKILSKLFDPIGDSKRMPRAGAFRPVLQKNWIDTGPFADNDYTTNNS
jgi:hypothetical protein